MTSDSATTITLDRPEQRNAVDRSLANRLADRFEAVAQGEVVVLRGSGSAFCAGWDLTDITAAVTAGGDEPALLLESGRRLLDAIDRSGAVVVAVVDGLALGFGISLLCHADIVIAASDARLGLPELDAGVVPASALGDLAAAVGSRRATAWALIGRIPLDDARAAGLVTHVVPADQLDAEVERAVDRLVGLGRAPIGATRRLGRTLAAAAPADRARIGDDHARVTLTEATDRR